MLIHGHRLRIRSFWATKSSAGTSVKLPSIFSLTWLVMSSVTSSSNNRIFAWQFSLSQGLWDAVWNFKVGSAVSEISGGGEISPSPSKSCHGNTTGRRGLPRGLHGYLSNSRHLLELRCSMEARCLSLYQSSTGLSSGGSTETNPNRLDPPSWLEGTSNNGPALSTTAGTWVHPAGYGHRGQAQENGKHLHDEAETTDNGRWWAQGNVWLDCSKWLCMQEYRCFALISKGSNS